MRPSPVRDSLVGLFVLAGLAAIAYLSISVGGLSYGGPGGLTVTAVFDQTGGVKTRAPPVGARVKVRQGTTHAPDPQNGASARAPRSDHAPGIPVLTTP